MVRKKKVWLRSPSKLDLDEWELSKEPRIFQKNIDCFLKNPRIGGPPTKKTSEKCFGVTSLAACGGPPPHYDYRPDLKAQYTSIIRARDEGELSLAAAQLNGVLRRKVTYHGHDGVRALYARFAPDASSHLADLGAVAISADCITPLRHNYAIAPIAYTAKVRKQPLSLPVVGSSVAQLVRWSRASRATPRAAYRHGGVATGAQRQRCSAE